MLRNWKGIAPLNTMSAIHNAKLGASRERTYEGHAKSIECLDDLIDDTLPL